jgi:NAD(P)-dependent dehydrogenase (short-subunit alcohol dehydrogenase family)
MATDVGHDGLAGHAVVVTGGGSGIGAAVCRQLAAAGARVGVLDRRSDTAQAVAAEVGGLALVADVGDTDSLEAALTLAHAELGGLRGLVNNAGVGNLKRFESYTDRDVDLIWKVNVSGVFAGIRAAAPLIRAAGGGAVVNVASVSGVRPTRGEAPYSAAKAAVVALTQAAALELGPELRVNCVSPGFVRTPLNEMLAADDGMRAGIEERTPLGRVGTAEEVADLVVFLLGRRAAYLTGQNVVLDGGSMLTSGQMDPVLGPLLDQFGGPPPA